MMAKMYQNSNDRFRFIRILLIFSYTGVFLATIVSYFNPATRYELSIYSGTPTIVLVFLSIPTILSSFIFLYIGVGQISKSIYKRLSIFSLYLSVITIVALPLIRGYYHVGEGDMLTHLGYVMEVEKGTLSSEIWFYPVVHNFVVILNSINGTISPHSFSIISITIALLFPIFVGVASQALSYNPEVFGFGVVIGLMYIPIDHISTHLQPSPRNFALFITPFVIYLFILSGYKNGFRFPALFFIFSTLLLLSHPQVSVMLTISLALCSIILLILYLIIRGSIYKPGEIYLKISLFISLITWIWIESRRTFESSISSLYTYVIMGISADREGGSAERASSLEALGGSIPEVFIKLLLVGFIFGSVSVIYYTLNAKKQILNRQSSQLSGKVLVGFSILIGISPILLISIMYMAINNPNISFRFLAFVLVACSILAPVAIVNWLNNFNMSLKTSLNILILFCLIMSVVVIHPSPYVYHGSGHVTESKMEGYETMFEYTDDVPFDHVRSGTSRYGNAIVGPSTKSRSEYYPDGVRRGGAPDHFADHDLANYYSTDTYLSITSSDKARDIIMYDGFRFNKDNFDYLESDHHIEKVYNNQGHQTYIVSPK